MPVVAIRKPSEREPSGRPAAPARKSLKANQKALDDVPMASGTWQVEGVQGLYLRARAKSKSFFLQRRVNGQLLSRTIGEMSMKDAREEASQIWPTMKRRKATTHTTFAQAFESYMEQTKLAEATIKIYRTNFSTYLKDWHRRPVSDIGTDREDLRTLHQNIRGNHKDAIANQVRRLLSTIYNYHRDGSNDDTLPAFPKKAVPLFSLKAREWAFNDDQLRAWWFAIKQTKDGEIECGVKTLKPLKRTYWLVSLFTGARPRSIENLKWTDIDFEKRIIRFRITKGDRPYTVPMADELHRILVGYRDSDSVPPSEWVFPGGRGNDHVTNVKNEKEGVLAKYHLRHTFKTRLTGLGFTNEQGKMLMGHSLGGDVATGYISAPLLIESLRPVVNGLAEHYLKIVPEIGSN